VFSLLLAFFALASLASGQTGTVSKHKVSQHQPLLATAVGVRPTKKNAPPPVTTDTWSGGGGSNTDWSDNSNWTNGAPSGQNVVIGPSAFSTVEDDSATIGTLTLSGSGDSVTVGNNTNFTVGGNIANSGTITLDSTGNNTILEIGASLTLSGSGSLVLGGTGTANDYIMGTGTLTVDQNVSGYGT